MYIGPDTSNSISTLAPTVAEEIGLHVGPIDRTEALADYLVEAMELQTLLTRNPLTLSGGEQARLVIATALALRPHSLALDCALEQVDRGYRNSILDHLTKTSPAGGNRVVGLADNRLSEYKLPDCFETIQVSGEGSQRGLLGKVRAIHRLAPTDPVADTIRAHELYFRYPSSGWILNGVSFELKPGEIYTLVGPNGAGKSTLSKILSGVLRPQRGRLSKGQTSFRPWRKPGEVFAYHFQDPDVQLFSKTVAEELAIGAKETKNRLPSNGLSRVSEVFGVDRVSGVHPLDLPFVGRKRVALAATFAMTRPWLILDEPTLGQDDETCSELAELIEAYAEGGGGVILITHSSSFQGMLSSISLTLDGGYLVNQNRSL